MKTRNGFVSNSSSSSFVIDAQLHSKIEIVKLIDDLLAESEYSGFQLEDVCQIAEYVNSETFDDIIEETGYGDFYDKLYFQSPILVVDSRHDNSIPWDIQDALEDLSIRRYHWG